jgi:5-methylcytosine-specific restriction endonuclease McrA
MSIENIRKIKELAKEPRIRKKYVIPKVSAKRKKQIEQDKQTFEEDKAFYLEIWLASPHVCQCGCNKKLGKEPLTLFFHHLLEKRNYPQFRHTPENIMILAPDCHQQAEADMDKIPKVRQRRNEVAKLLGADL